MKSIGYVAVPTFFWDGQGDRQVTASRLILMGVWRDSMQPRFEETGAIINCIQMKEFETAAKCRRGFACSLDLGRLMGVPIVPASTAEFTAALLKRL